MNSQITNENTLRIEDIFKKAVNNNKNATTNFSDIVLNQQELDILSKEILEEKSSQIPKEDNNQININLSKAEINTLLNEINKKSNINNEEKTFLNKKRRKNFISVKIQQEKQNFIHYKTKKIINQENDDVSRNKVSLLSYNILNQIFMKKMNRPDLNIDYRMNKIKEEILKLNPDIFCLQEADIFVYKKYLLKNDMEQYNILYGINCGSSFINIIAYKKDKFELKSFKNFSLLFLGKSAGNRGIMTVDLQLKNDEQNNITNNKEEKEQNKLNNAKNITIYNVHFPWKFENDRILLMNLLFQHIKENHNIEEDNNNIFIVGDFNSEPPSRTIKLFYYNNIKNDKRNFYIKKYKRKKKSFDLQTMQLSEYIFNHFKFQSAYQCYSKEKMIDGDIMRHPLFTSRTKFYKRTIDYIFFSKNAQLNKILKLPKYYNVDKEKYLPSKEYPSDHLKLFAEFLV